MAISAYFERWRILVHVLRRARRWSRPVLIKKTEQQLPVCSHGVKRCCAAVTPYLRHSKHPAPCLTPEHDLEPRDGNVGSRIRRMHPSISQVQVLPTLQSECHLLGAACRSGKQTGTNVARRSTRSGTNIQAQRVNLKMIYLTGALVPPHAYHILRRASAKRVPQ